MIKSIEDDFGRVDERNLHTPSSETGGSEERMKPLKIGFDRGRGGRFIDVSLAEIDCFNFAILTIK